jgi:hypothetical protein
MMILIRCLRRAPALSRAEFQEHWLQHAQRRLAGAGDVRWSVQYHAVVEPAAGAESGLARIAADEADYDGVSAEWFDDLDTMQRYVDGEWFRADAAQESWFIDLDRSTVQVAEPHLIFEPEDVGIVLLQLVRKRRDLDRPDFRRIWLEHAPLGYMMKDRGWLKGYYQLHFTDDAAPPPLRALGRESAGWDGIVLSYFESIAMIKAMSADPGMTDSYEHAVTFLDESGWLAMTMRRHLLKAPIV